jgi:hypothetical protein
MSTGNQAAGPSRSNNNFLAIFQAALIEFETVTGKSLHGHPFSTQLETCDNTQAVLNVLQTQAETFSRFRNRNERLMAWLDPTVNILFTLSTTLGEGIGLVSPLISLGLSSPDIWLSAVLACENDLHGDRCTSHGGSLFQVPCRACV